MPLKISMFSDFICPFCYIGFEILRALRSDFDFQLEWRGYQIHPEWPAEGIPAERIAHAHPPSRRAIWERIEALAEPINLSIAPPSVLTSSRLALEAAEFANDAGSGEHFEARVYRAYFTEGLNIGDREVIGTLAREVGLDPTALDHALASGRYSLKLKNNSLVASQRGVGGVPTFFINGFPLVGAQSPDVMRQVLARAAERLPAD